MRKISMGVVLLIFMAAVLSAQTVTVTQPSGGTWVKGQTYQIIWTKSGIMPDLVRISLRNANTLAEVALIQDNVASTGSCPWLIPGNTPVGQFRIRVKVKDVAVQDDSDIFNIAAAAPAGTIDVWEPGTYLSVWREGQGHAVQWKITGSLSGTYTGLLMDSTATNIVSTLFTSGNCCSYGFDGPHPFVPGQYRVRVRNDATGIFGDSAVFTLSPDTIILTQPIVSTKWQKTRTYTITWTRKGTQPNTVRIELNDQTSSHTHIIDYDAPNTGSFSYKVPADMEVGPYYIKISTNVPGLYGQTPIFHIINLVRLPVEKILKK